MRPVCLEGRRRVNGDNRIYNVELGISGLRDIKLQLDLDESVQREVAAALKSGIMFDPELGWFLLKVLRPGDVFYDVGANFGFFSLLAAAVVGPEGRVYAFEPGAASLDALRVNRDRNAAQEIEIVPKAVAERPGRVFYSDNGERDRNGAIFPQDPGDGSGVEAITLDGFLTGTGRVPKVVKLDIEGAELLALRGAGQLLAEPALEFVVCEINAPRLRALGCDPDDILPLMTAAGFTPFLMADLGERPVFVPPGTQVLSKFVFNILFARVDRLARYWPEIRFESAIERHERAAGRIV